MPHSGFRGTTRKSTRTSSGMDMSILSSCAMLCFPSTTSGYSSMSSMSNPTGDMSLGISVLKGPVWQPRSHSVTTRRHRFGYLCLVGLATPAAGKDLPGARLYIDKVYGVFPPGPAVGIRYRNVCQGLRGEKTALAELGSGNENDDVEWASEMSADLAKPRNKAGRTRREQRGVSAEWLAEEERQVEWSLKARERAIKAIQDRGLSVKSVLESSKRKKEKPKKKAASTPRVSPSGDLEKAERLISSLDEDRLGVDGNEIEGLEDLTGGDESNNGNGWKMELTNAARKGYFGPAAVQESSASMVPSLKMIAGPRVLSMPSKQKRQEDFELNRMLVSASDVAEVLSNISNVLGDDLWVHGESPLSTVNVSTALHRVAKNMETVSMHKSDRLAWARQKIMAHLVNVAMESLPQCSAQSISNIAWALSKVGGNSLYWSEMDRIAEVAARKISEFAPQQVANIAGALASMQHSVTPLFQALDRRASQCHSKFRPQELAQLLWAFATLSHPAKLLLDSLDSECETSVQGTNNGHQDKGSGLNLEDGDNALTPDMSDNFEARSQESLNFLEQDAVLEPGIVTDRASTFWSLEEYFQTFSLSQLSSLCWSYTVLDELRRPSFTLLWNAILNQSQEATGRVQDRRHPSLEMSQLYQTNLSLQLEYPELNLSLTEPLRTLTKRDWEKTKSSITNKSSSVTQLDVGKLLVGMGRNWVAECRAAEYSLDAALLEEKIGLEIDGPSHFTRNTGMPLGHTLLKRRQLSAAGWTVLSIPYEEWDEQQGETDQRRYLYNLLSGHL